MKTLSVTYSWACVSAQVQECKLLGSVIKTLKIAKNSVHCKFLFVYIAGNVLTVLIQCSQCDVLTAAEATHILESEADLLDMPQPLPTIEELDHRRNLMKLSRQ